MSEDYRTAPSKQISYFDLDIMTPDGIYLYVNGKPYLQATTLRWNDYALDKDGNKHPGFDVKFEMLRSDLPPFLYYIGIGNHKRSQPIDIAVELVININKMQADSKVTIHQTYWIDSYSK